MTEPSPALAITVAPTRATRADVAVPVQVVRVAGEVDRVTAPTLAAALAWAQTVPLPPGPGAGLRRVVVDVAAMTFCSVAGMTVLVDAAATRGTVWALGGLTPRLSRLIGDLWPDRHLVGYPDRATAITAVGLGPPWPAPGAPWPTASGPVL